MREKLPCSRDQGKVDRWDTALVSGCRIDELGRCSCRDWCGRHCEQCRGCRECADCRRRRLRSRCPCWSTTSHMDNGRQWVGRNRNTAGMRELLVCHRNTRGASKPTTDRHPGKISISGHGFRGPHLTGRVPRAARRVVSLVHEDPIRGEESRERLQLDSRSVGFGVNDFDDLWIERQAYVSCVQILDIADVDDNRTELSF